MSLSALWGGTCQAQGGAYTKAARTDGGWGGRRQQGGVDEGGVRFKSGHRNGEREWETAMGPEERKKVGK